MVQQISLNLVCDGHTYNSCTLESNIDSILKYFLTALNTLRQHSCSFNPHCTVYVMQCDVKQQKDKKIINIFLSNILFLFAIRRKFSFTNRDVLFHLERKSYSTLKSKMRERNSSSRKSEKQENGKHKQKLQVHYK